MRIEIGGVAFEDEAAVQDAVRAQLRGGGVWSGPGDEDAADRRARALRWAGTKRGPVVKALYHVVVDPRAPVDARFRAARLLRAAPAAVAVHVTSLALGLERRAERYFGMRPEAVGADAPDLGWQVLAGMAPAVRREHHRAIELLRRRVVEPPGHLIAEHVARLDPEWVIANAGAIGHGCAAPLLRGLPSFAQRARLVRALEPWLSAARAATATQVARSGPRAPPGRGRPGPARP